MKTVYKFTTLFSFVLLFAANEVAHAQNGVCRVTAFTIEQMTHSPNYSDPTLVGEFDLKFEGTMIVERFQHKESGVSISVHLVRLNSIFFTGKPMALKIGIQLTRSPDSYNFYGGATETILDKNWKGASVSSHFKVGDYKGYTFTVACEKRKK